jgi:hypothetical protein
MKDQAKQNGEIIFSDIVRFNIKVIGLVLGVLTGLTVFVATNWLVLKGGYVDSNGMYVVGPHLQLLSQFFIGYRVSFLGSIVGFIYGFSFGTLCGTAIGWIYDKIVKYRYK